MVFLPEDLKRAIDEAEAVAVGIGSEFQLRPEDTAAEEKTGRLLAAYNRLEALLTGKNYFIITTCTDGIIYRSALEKERITSPTESGNTGEEAFTRWEAYTGWLQRTLNRRLVLLELGADFFSPAVIRWPFERIAMLNNKAMLYRVNGKFPQLPEGMGGKAAAMGENSIKFILSL